MRPGEVNRNYFPLFYSQTHVSRHLAPCNPWKCGPFLSGSERFDNRPYLYIKGNFLFLGVNKTVPSFPISVLIWFKMKVNYVLWNSCHKGKLEYSVWKFIGPSCVLFICVSVVQRNVNTQHFIRKHINNRLCRPTFKRSHIRDNLRWSIHFWPKISLETILTLNVLFKE